MKKGIIIFLSWSSLLFAQEDFLKENTIPYQVITYIHHFEYEQAEKLIEKSGNELPDEEKYFLWVNYYWWVYVTSNDKKNFRDSLLVYINKTNRIIEKKNLEKSYIALINNGFEYRLAFKEDRFKDGLVSAHRMAKQIQTALDSARFSPYYKLTASIYLFSTGYAKEKYWVLYPYFLMIPKGDVKKGIKYLEELSNHPNRIFATEAAYTLMRIYMDIYADYKKAYPLAEKIVELHPGNLFYRALLMKIKEKLNKLSRYDLYLYGKIYARTDFINKESKEFFKDWHNIK
jgi:tetratricopeptide (TPR) repeat protein